MHAARAAVAAARAASQALRRASGNMMPAGTQQQPSRSEENLASPRQTLEDIPRQVGREAGKVPHQWPAFRAHSQKPGRKGSMEFPVQTASFYTCLYLCSINAICCRARQQVASALTTMRQDTGGTEHGTRDTTPTRRGRREAAPLPTPRRMSHRSVGRKGAHPLSQRARS